MVKKLLESFRKNKKQFILRFLRGYIWFVCGVVLGLFFFVSSVYIYFKRTYAEVIYPGVYVNSIDFSGKTRQEVASYFASKNKEIHKSSFYFTVEDKIATISAKDLQFGYDEQLLADQAFSIGRSKNTLSDFSLIIQAYMHGIHLPPSYHYAQAVLEKEIEPIKKELYKEPVNARFEFVDGRVKEFETSENGQDIDMAALQNRLEAKTLSVIAATTPQNYTIPIPIKVLKPTTTTEEVNDLGIKELVASGTSLFVGSIPNRIYNIALAATRLDGILIKPGEVFSFNKAVGDISTFTGYKQAYVIQNGRTVLGDGGGVCQVSTTFFRAVLNAGLPVVERNPHAYRVSYYEQDAGPGFDAAIYVPTVDFRFKNDTAHHLLLKTVVDPDAGRLTFELYGTKDNRTVELSKSVVSSVTSSPEPLYIDDPTLPKGELKQIDYAVPGATVYFTRTVKKDGKVIANDKFNSYYRAWQAVYQRGTKE